ncbi:unnamed protein product (macronuclear) [Paramecium tetraurelia]|uniref:Tubulin--tyrosine ligase-like protein 9 n=1 Tax=Paramecium tetraurelia TaxID=5888 RepID=A0DSY9_PARTE|nr:uncharacterized protein GSPATT00019849001 [Paramecium tetraurelia]CAK86156.1 unnamed protein product [Paramecium tetraurelia]|eukprot:XP_001453553.1 hypothetical protein (macronuclear) [Paramecium tetraurelia strain d4-2]
MSEYFRKYIKKEHYANHQYQFMNQLQLKPQIQNFFQKLHIGSIQQLLNQAFKRRLWKETDGDDWDIMWAEKEWIHEVMDHTHLQSNQKINHFRNHYELTRKDLMIKNFKRYKKNLEREGKNEEANNYNFFPLTFHLPSEYPIFFEEFKRQSNNGDTKTAWIMKPIGKSQGKGIFIFNKIQQISQWKNTLRYNQDNPQAEAYIVQKYIADPLLIGGKKFDMRIYLLCTSYQPLTLYLYRTGFARFTHHRYDNEDISNTYVHLTNVAIQKTSDNYDEKLGGKWNLQTLKLYLMTKYGQEKVAETFYNIQMLMIRSLQAVQKIIINDKHCFELYGFDILLDAQLKPWLLEVNASPSMTSNTPVDFELKCGLLDDVFTIIDLEKVLTGNEEQIGGFDLICKGNPIKLPVNSTFTTYLGAFNNRSQQLKKIAKSTAIRLAQSYQEGQTKAIEVGSKGQKEKEEKDKQMRSSSKGPQVMQNGVNGSIKTTNQSKQNTIIKRNTTNLPALGTAQNKSNIKRYPLQNAGQQSQQIQQSQNNSSKKNNPNEDSMLSANQKLQKLTQESKINQFQPYKQQSQYNDVMGMGSRNLQKNEE